MNDTSGPTMNARESFPPEPASVRSARHFVAEAVSGSENHGDIVLVASELASNAVRHAGTDFTVAVTGHDRRICLEVSDHSGLPVQEGLDDSHRGLRVVEGLTHRWGVDTTGSGKTVWAVFRHPTPTGS